MLQKPYKYRGEAIRLPLRSSVAFTKLAPLSRGEIFFQLVQLSLSPFAIFHPNFAKLSRQKQPNEGSLGHFSLPRSRYLLSLAHERSEIAKMTHIEVSCDQNLHLRGVWALKIAHLGAFEWCPPLKSPNFLAISRSQKSPNFLKNLRESLAQAYDARDKHNKWRTCSTHARCDKACRKRQAKRVATNALSGFGLEESGRFCVAASPQNDTRTLRPKPAVPHAYAANHPTSLAHFLFLLTKFKSLAPLSQRISRRSKVRCPFQRGTARHRRSSGRDPRRTTMALVVRRRPHARPPRPRTRVEGPRMQHSAPRRPSAVLHRHRKRRRRIATGPGAIEYHLVELVEAKGFASVANPLGLSKVLSPVFS